MNGAAARNTWCPLHPAGSVLRYFTGLMGWSAPYPLHARDFTTIQVLVALQIEAGLFSIIVSSAGRRRNVYFPE